MRDSPPGHRELRLARAVAVSSSGKHLFCLNIVCYKSRLGGGAEASHGGNDRREVDRVLAVIDAIKVVTISLETIHEIDAARGVPYIERASPLVASTPIPISDVQKSPV
jgi:hypothetical protein